MSINRKPGLYIPNPFEIAILLTLLVLILASLFTQFDLRSNVGFWVEGLWSLLAFMTQMSLILMGGYILALSPFIQKNLTSIARVPKTEVAAYLLTFLISALVSWLNWGLGMMAGSFLCLEMAKQHKKLHFPLLVAIAYMGFIFWHGGMSGSIPLLVATPGNFSEKWLGKLVSTDMTIFSASNFSIIICLVLSLSVLILVFINRHKGESISIDSDAMPIELHPQSSRLFSKLMCYSLIALICGAILVETMAGGFSLGLNKVNLMLFVLGLMAFKNLNAYMGAARQAGEKLVPILVQYPLYAGIMAVMTQSGLASQISQFFINISDPQTFASLMFLSAGVVNFFVPSGGGQWAVQAPVVIEGAKQLGVPLEKAIMAVAWGDAWTNLVQPFWALPLLSIVGLQLKDILGYCLSALVVSGFVIASLFLVF